MKTDITTGISGAAGTPLSHQAIQSGRDSGKPIAGKVKSSEAISDTLETTDREADGRRTLVIEVENQDQQSNQDPAEETNGIDLIG